MISDDLKWDKQFIAAVKQRNKVLGMRNFVDRSKDTIMAFYKSLVRPHLEYCTPIWSPHLIKDIKLVEGVRAATEELQSWYKALHTGSMTRLQSATAVAHEHSSGLCCVVSENF